jgi:hypothetical protein
VTFPLIALGVTLLELEELSEGAVMNVGGVMVFDALPEGGAPSAEEVQALVEDRLSGLHGYRQRLSDARTGGWSWPPTVVCRRRVGAPVALAGAVGSSPAGPGGPRGF